MNRGRCGEQISGKRDNIYVMRFVDSSIRLVFCFVFFGQLLQAGDVESAFKAARRAMGSEDALRKVNSVHFYGSVVAEDSGSRAKLRIVFAKPHLSWMEIKTDEMVEVVVANKIEGFVSRKHKNSGKSKVDILPAKATSRINNMAWQGLHFFASPKARFGKATNDGFVKVDDRMCQKVTIRYPGGLWTSLYFDKNTGKHFITQADNGLRYVKSGEIVVDGIRFPKEITVFERGREARRMIFEKISVNRPVDSSIFEFPTES